MSNTNPFIAHIRDLIEKDAVKTAIQELSALLKNSPRLDEAVQQSARYNNVMEQIRLGTVDFQAATIVQNQIRYATLQLLREIEEQEETQPRIKAEVERYAVKNSVNQTKIRAGGNLDKALGFYEGFNRLEKELYTAYPNNVDFKNNLAESFLALGNFFLKIKSDKTKARAYFKQAEVLWKELVRDAPQYVQFQKFLGIIQEDLIDFNVLQPSSQRFSNV